MASDASNSHHDSVVLGVAVTGRGYRQAGLKARILKLGEVPPYKGAVQHAVTRLRQSVSQKTGNGGEIGLG